MHVLFGFIISYFFPSTQNSWMHPMHEKWNLPRKLCVDIVMHPKRIRPNSCWHSFNIKVISNCIIKYDWNNVIDVKLTI